MINSDQIHVAMTKMSGRVATLVCQSNIPMKSKMKERAVWRRVSAWMQLPGTLTQPVRVRTRKSEVAASC